MAHKKSVGVAGTLERLGKICFQTCFWALTEKRLNPSILSDQVGTGQMKKEQD